MTTVHLPWESPPVTQNGLRRMHHHAEATAKKRAREEAQWAIRATKPTPRAGANVTLHWRMPDRRRRDSDGAAPTLKVVLDALVAEGVLPDDSWVEVPHSGIATHPAVKGQPGELWVTLTDPEET